MVRTLDAAIATGQKILADQSGIDDWDGLEIWLDQALLYKSPLQASQRKLSGKA